MIIKEVTLRRLWDENGRLTKLRNPIRSAVCQKACAWCVGRVRDRNRINVFLSISLFCIQVVVEEDARIQHMSEVARNSDLNVDAI